MVFEYAAAGMGGLWVARRGDFFAAIRNSPNRQLALAPCWCGVVWMCAAEECVFGAMTTLLYMYIYIYSLEYCAHSDVVSNVL